MQGRYWLLTIPENAWSPNIHEKIQYIKGQKEIGHNTGYIHWQVLVIFKRGVRLACIKKIFGQGVHAELTKSKAANDYVWKDDTSVPDTRFELGSLPINRNSSRDWDAIKNSAKRGLFDEIPSDILIRSYSNLRRLYADSLKPEPMQKKVHVFWGRTGTGKSRRAWEEATFDAYPKDPNTKFWDGYQGQTKVVIDEFRGLISISNMLRWLDRYPVIVEIKGSSTVLRADEIWITSNMDPKYWYPDIDVLTRDALLRRLDITFFE